MAALIVIGQWLHVYLLVIPGVTGTATTIGVLEIGMAVVYLSIFLFVFFKSLSKAPLVVHGHPFLVESEGH